MGRYLTYADKARELTLWERTKREVVAPVDRPDKIAGHGYPDPEIFDACDRLNAIDGVCTLQSCAGHWSPEYHDDFDRLTRIPWPGSLWLWLDERMAHAFDHHAFDLALHPNVEQVSRIYHRHDGEGREILDITFLGSAHGVLRESVEMLVGFFAGLGVSVGGEVLGS